ncbi:MAG: tetratricopeptide repeat protein [Verrucomicrobiales bacterium]|nr:tetratricopeptide repeat protein [Verrucomicrobiales bacterium]
MQASRPFHTSTLAQSILIVLSLGLIPFTLSTEAAPEDSAQPTDSKSKIESPSADETKDHTQDGSFGSESQFKKNTSSSGMQIGIEQSSRQQALPENVKELAKEGALASANKEWDAAKQAYLKMTQAAPGNALALSNLGIVEYRLKDYKNASHHLEESVKINPRISQNWLTLGLSYYYLKQFNLAISSLTRARHEDPKDPRTCLYLAVVIRDYGWGRAAETELMRAIALDPEYADAHFNLALLYMERTPPAIELARRHYFTAIDLGAQRDEEIEKQLKRIKTKTPKK